MGEDHMPTQHQSTETTSGGHSLSPQGALLTRAPSRFYMMNFFVGLRELKESTRHPLAPGRKRPNEAPADKHSWGLGAY